MEELQNKLTVFAKLLNDLSEELATKNIGLNRFKYLAGQTEQIVSAIIEMGDACANKVADFPKNKEALPYYFFGFDWNAKAKSFVILMRDILFEEQKASIYSEEGKVKNASVKALKDASNQTLKNAAEELIAFFPNEIQKIKNQEGGIQKQIEQWALQDNPQLVYKNQFNQITLQCYTLTDQYQLAKQLAVQFSSIRSLINETNSKCTDLVSGLEKLTKTAIEFIESNSSENIGKIAYKLEDWESEIIVPAFNQSFKAKLENETDALPQKANIVVGIQGGMLLQRELNIQRTAKKWLDAEIQPLLYEIWELTEEIGNVLKMTLVNVRNRAILLTNEAKASGETKVVGADLSQPLFSFLKKIDGTKMAMSNLEKDVAARSNKHLKVARVYELENEFLPIPLEKTLSRFRLKEHKWIQQLQALSENLIGSIRAFKTTVEKRESQSISERVVQYIQHHTLNDNNTQYSSIFLTKGHIGASFWVGRQIEMERMSNLVNDWKSGFRGAVILSGKRFSGKSFFGDTVAERFFKNNTIRLQPNSTVVYQGRKFHAKNDIGEILEALLKLSFSSKPMLWIDDIELWANSDYPLGKNIRRICQFVDRNYDKFFVVVSMGNWTKARFDLSHKLDNAFTAEINLDSMKFKEVYEAIVIRHGATHKLMVDDKGDEIGVREFKKVINNIYYQNAGIIGEALQEWAVQMHLQGHDKVKFESNGIDVLPDFLNADSATLLSAIMLEKRTNEYRLRKMFGPAFKEDYGHILQRLVSLGVLIRTVDGSLEFNNIVANKIGNMLEQKRFLRFQKQTNQ